jgi:hypothetical protein
VNNIKPEVVLSATWSSRLGASCPRLCLPGTGVPAAGFGTGMSVVAARPLPRVRGKVAPVSTQAVATAAQLGQPDNHNYMIRVPAVGEGASGPPTYWEPA